MDSISSISAANSRFIDKSELFDLINNSENLPVLPDLALKVIYLSEDPDIYPAKVQALISQDPVLAARILQISNSPAYAGQSQILDIAHAVTRLGVKLSLDISLGFLLVDTMRKNADTQGFDHDYFWRKSILSAVISNELCGSLKVTAKGQMFLSSLIQDVGMLVLLTVLGNDYAELIAGQIMHIDCISREREYLGTDHAEVGAYLMEQWGMPQDICSAIAKSHSLFNSEEPSAINDLEYGVALSGVVAELWMANSEDDLLQDILGVYVDKMGQDSYHATIAAVLEEIPEASNVFDMTLLTTDEMSHIQQ